MMAPLKDLDKKKDHQDPNSLNCSQKLSKGKLDTAENKRKLEIDLEISLYNIKKFVEKSTWVMSL